MMMPINWLLNEHLRERYKCTRMTIIRRVKEGKLPQPSYPFGNSIPAWREDELDAFDLAVVAKADAERKSASGKHLIATHRDRLVENAAKAHETMARNRKAKTKIKPPDSADKKPRGRRRRAVSIGHESDASQPE
jgi:hypothetical protein